MSEQELLVYSLMTGCGLFFLINPTFKMAKDKRTPDRIRTIRFVSFAMALFGGIMMVRYFT